VRRGLRGALAAVVLAGATAAAADPATDFAVLAAAEAGVVVSIRTVATRPARRDEEADDSAEPDAARLPGLERGRPLRGMASGFVIAPDGFILTCAHVVRGVAATTVRLGDGRELVGRVVGSDEPSDVALLKVTAEGLQAARPGSSVALVPGNWVAAIGAPFGLEASLTAGVVSARRDLAGHFGIPFLQSDVAMNPGNSGGPLFNGRGEVVGLNSMAYTTSGGSMGVSFSLPIEVAMDVARQLRAGGRVVRGRLGVKVQEATPALARAFGRTEGGGALVVAAGAAPAEVLFAGDIVLGPSGGVPLGYAALQQLVAGTAPGTRLRLDVWRGAQVVAVEVEVKAAVLPAEPAASHARGGDVLGLVLVEAATGLREKLEARAGLDVREAYGPALRAGIGAGDRILALNASPTPDRASYAAAVGRLHPGEAIAVLVLRERRSAWVAMQAED